MQINDVLLSRSERLVFQLKQLYLDNGFRSYRMSKFEEYDLYAENKDFLVSDNVLTFTDTNGRLMALKPDVTLSIIKNARNEADKKEKIFYNENVYRANRNSLSYREILQTGIECFGKLEEKDICETIRLAIESLRIVSDDPILVLSDLSLSETIINRAGLRNEKQKELFTILKEKKIHELEDPATESGLSEEAKGLLKKLIRCNGTIEETIPWIEGLCTQSGYGDSFIRTLKTLQNEGLDRMIRIDFSLTDDINYYNGIIFKGYIPSYPDPILSGGQYDRLLKKMGRSGKAIGFAVYTGSLETNAEKKDSDDYLNIALPKGRLGENVYKRFAKAGYDCPSMEEDSRKLIYEDAVKKIRFFWVKPTDVPVYVERASADIGIAGSDVIRESKAAVYEMLDLKTGLCRMAVAAKKGFEDDPGTTLRVATKYPRIAEAYYQSQGRDIDIIELNGSIEIAPIIGMSDVIVDIVETGRTLKENGLEIKEEIMPISARLIANRSSYEYKKELIDRLISALSEKKEERA